MKRKIIAMAMVLVILLALKPFINRSEPVLELPTQKTYLHPLETSNAKYEVLEGIARATPKRTEQDKTKPTPSITPEPTPSPTPEMKQDNAEYELLCRIVALEGDSRYGYESYYHVATVIMNRVKHQDYPDTITGVLSQQDQFSTYRTNRTPYYHEWVFEAVNSVLNGNRSMPEYVIGFVTIDYYNKNAQNSPWLSKATVYDISHNSVWFYFK